MTDIFAPYNVLYYDTDKQYGNINNANSKAKMLAELPQGEGYAKLPFYCYAYDSIFTNSLHLNIPVYTSGEVTINGSIINYGDYIKHYISFFPNLVVQNCLGDTDRVTNDNYNNNIAAFKPLDIDFNKVRIGMQYTVMHKSSKQTSIVVSTTELIDRYNTNDYVVTETKCNIMYDNGYNGYSYNYNGFSDIAVNFNISDKWVFANHPVDYGQHGLQLVPQWWLRLYDNGTEAYSPIHDADTGYVLQGINIQELKISTQDDFCDLHNGMLLYKSNQYYNGVEYKPVLTVSQCLREVAFLGLAVCDFENAESNVYMGYINSDGLATGDLIPYANWNDSDSLNLVNTFMSDYSESIVVKPKPTDIDNDDTEKMDIGGFYTAGGLVNYYSLVNTPEHNPLDELSENLSNWDYVETGKDVLRNLISLKAVPIQRDHLCRGITKEITIAGTKTGVNGQTVDATYNYIDFGNINIPHRYNDFRDYAPYTTIEVCAPFVGWIRLPSHTMGHNISVKMTYDIITCNCKVFVILDDNTVVADRVGTIGMDIPFTAEGVGVKTASMISSAAGVASSALSLGTGIVSGNTMGMASGIIGLANSVTQTICANNANYTETVGNTGDANNFSGVKQCILKVTYPISHISENYGHYVGYLYNKTVTLVKGAGFTKTANTYINGNMSETEKQEIISLMENGVIL